MLYSRNRLALPLTGRTPTGLPVAMTNLEMGGNAQERFLLLRDGAATRLYSTTTGVDWQPLADVARSGSQTVDLTDKVLRRYDYRLRVTLRGAGTDPHPRTLRPSPPRLTTWMQPGSCASNA